MPSLQDIVDKVTGGVAGPQSRPQSMIPVQGPVQPTPTSASEPSIISSSQGGRVVDNTAKQLAAIEGMPAIETTNETTKETNAITTGTPDIKTAPPAEDKKQEDYVTYINPETGAEKTLRGDAISDAARISLENNGWTISEESSSKTSAVTQAEQQRKSAETELNSSMAQLQQATISDNDLRSTVSSIRTRYSARMRQMEEINRRREQTLNTLGVRLGSRYTGGSGGVFGGIIAEEERQGIERVTTIEGEMLKAISDAKKAAKEHNYSVFVKMTELAQKKFDDKQKAVEDLRKVQEEKDKEIKEEANLVANQSAVIEQIQGGMKTPADIFAALGGTVPFDVIKEITDTLPEAAETEQFTLGRYDVRYDSTGKLIASGLSAGGGAGGDNGDITLSVDGNGGFIATPKGAATVQGLGSTYANSTPNAKFIIERIFNGLPTQLKNNVAEHPLWKNSILNYLKNGYTEQEIKDELSGFALFNANAKDKALGTTLYSLSAGTEVKPEELAGLVNRGNLSAAMLLVENNKLKDVDLFFASNDEARAYVSATQTALNLLNKPNFPKKFLGSFDGRVFKAQRFLGADATEEERKMLQQLETQLAIINAPIRVSVAGTAATPSEMDKIQGFQADILDNPGTIDTILRQMQDSVLQFHNSARQQRGLPTVSSDTITDNKKRLELYNQMAQVNQEVSYSAMPNSDFLGSWGGFEPEKVSADDNKSFFSNY